MGFLLRCLCKSLSVGDSEGFPFGGDGAFCALSEPCDSGSFFPAAILCLLDEARSPHSHTNFMSPESPTVSIMQTFHLLYLQPLAFVSAQLPHFHNNQFHSSTVPITVFHSLHFLALSHPTHL